MASLVGYFPDSQPPRSWATPSIWSSSVPIPKKGRWKVKAWGQVSCWAQILAQGVNNTPRYQSYLLLPPKLTQSFLWPGALARASSAPSPCSHLALILLQIPAEDKQTEDSFADCKTKAINMRPLKLRPGNISLDERVGMSSCIESIYMFRN